MPGKGREKGKELRLQHATNGKTRASAASLSHKCTENKKGKMSRKRGKKRIRRPCGEVKEKRKEDRG